MSQSEPAQLNRSLRLRETAALTFSTAGATAGIYSLFGFSVSFAGPAFFWGWILIGLFVGAVCLIWAELASRMPLAGSFFHWSTSVGGRGFGWWVGWLYLIAQCWVLTGWYFLVPVTVGPLFDVEFTPVQAALVAFAVIALATVLNSLGIELLGRIIFIGVVLELIVAFGLTTWLLIASEKQPLSVFFDIGQASGFAEWLPLLLGAGIFLPLWVLFTFESAGAVGEETKNARRTAPRAVMLAWLGTMIIGTYFLVVVILAIPDVGQIMASGTPLPDIFDAWLPAGASKVFLVLLLGIELLGCNAFFTAVSRQVFGMSRAGLLPGSRFLSRTRKGTPYASIIAVGVVTSLPLLIAQQMQVLAGGATAAIYVAYTILLGGLLVARLRGWPKRKIEGAFALGGWGIPVNIIAFAFALGALILLHWPSDLTNPEFGPLRVSYWLVGVPVLVGVPLYLWWRARGNKDATASEVAEELAEQVEQSTDRA